jgi:RHS repeat-associated protein
VVRDGFAGSSEFSGLVGRIYGTASDDNQRTLLFVYKLYSALNRDPSSTELQAGIDRLTAKAIIGQSDVIAEAQAFAREIFSSTEYANRSRSDHDFVQDLYLATVQRAPDTSGWDSWTTAVASSGRTSVREGFLTGGEFQYLAGTLYREEFWLVSDHLGTPRMVVDKSGALAGVKRHDYLPFGEELGAGTGGRTTTQGYSASDGIRQKFTDKERDTETGLDYFGERYYASTMGRFTSVDPLGASARLSNPQSMNRYVFVLNNPLRYVDPDGLKEKDPWDQLNDEERRALAPKLVSVNDPNKITNRELKAAGGQFNQLTKVYNADGTLNTQATGDRVATAQNFVQNFTQGTPPQQNAVYQQIDQIKAIGRSTIEVTVRDKDQFLAALSKEGYAVNSADEYVANAYARMTKGSVDHPFDSARAPTIYATDPELHYANDRANDPAYGPNYFFAHWDPASVNCDFGCGPIGRAASGSQHSSGAASPAQVRDYYKRTYKAPVP